MTIPKFLLAPDHKAMELFIIHTEFPMCVIHVHQSIPAQLHLHKCELLDDDESMDELEDGEIETLTVILKQAAEFYRTQTTLGNEN